MVRGSPDPAADHRREAGSERHRLTQRADGLSPRQSEPAPPDRIVISLRDGPFRRLDGIWQFRALSDSACKVEFELNYEFATPVLEGLIGPVFGRIADSFIDAFVKRAAAVHGGGA
jgi:ribosome-associated toxin RatA of RatAB toxin-antitoxin module